MGSYTAIQVAINDGIHSNTGIFLFTSNKFWALSRKPKILKHNLFYPVVQLKEIVKALEKLNGNGRWKWLLHYRENKKLKEDVR